MHTTFSRTLPLIVGLALTLGCTRKAADQKVSDEIDFGTLSGSTYRNDYFGLTLTLPSDWSIQDQEERQRLMKVGARVVAGDDKNMQAVVKAIDLQTVNLFTAFKYPLGAPVAYNPAIMCLAERIRHMPGIKTGEDYLFHARKLLESGQMQVSFPKEMSTERFAGREFGVMHVEMPLRGTVVSETYYVTIMKGYGLAFILAFTTAEEEASLESVLRAATFE